MRYFLLSTLASLAFIFNVYSTTADISSPEQVVPFSLTDEYLQQIAVEKGVLAENWREINLNKEIQERNTIVMWIVMSSEEKAAVVNGLKESFKENGIIISQPTEFYVSEINNAIYRSILTGDINSTNKKGLGAIFKTVALIEGDFGDGTNRVESLKEYIGQDKFEEYKKLYPAKYERLLKMDAQ